ncbi:MAG: peptidylprolyl isomerase [Chloroflexi bacterium]|nr:peptidylprolyl isomerase [Chloroflexota bacterium]
MAIDTNKTYHVTMETEKGIVKADLFTKDAPVTVNNFVFLARQGFYDNLSFHRVINNFMADPSGNGTGGPGYKFEDEIVNNPHKVDEGVLAMANSGPNTNGSQFFITTAPAPHLNGLHTVFGKVTEGLDVVKKLTQGDPLPPAQLKENLIKKVTIGE